MAEHDHVAYSRLLSQIRSEFDRIRWQTLPIRAELVHRATNAEAEGVVGIPGVRNELIVAFQGAGHREATQVMDNDGNPKFRDDPIVDVTGRPITNSAGQAFEVVMPAFRSVTFSGRSEDYHQLAAIAERAGRVVANLDGLSSMDLLQGWSFSSSSDLWWALLFEMAWSQRHPLIVAEKRLWLPAEQPATFVPYDLQKLNNLASSGLGALEQIPKNWLKRLPEAWVSQLENVAAASLDAAELLLSEVLPSTASEGIGKDLTQELVSAEPTMTKVPIKRRFAVALSFPGERREFVDAVAMALRPALGEQRVFYDKFHQVELSRPNLDIVLQRFYAEDSDLVVAFVCGEYSEKEWCGLEWRAIRELIKNRTRADEDVMFLRFDKKPLDGLLSIDGFMDISAMSEREVADSILRRWTALR